MTIVGIGQCSWDLITVVDHYPEVDSKNEVLLWEAQGGGPVATALVALSRLGMACRFHGVTGDDDEAGKIRRSLLHDRIDLDGLIQREGASSQIAFIAVTRDDGKRTIFWKRPTGRALMPHELDKNFLAGASFLLLDGLMPEVSLFAARRANEMNIPVMLDAGTLREGMLDLARHCDYVVAAERFARALGFQDHPESFGKVIRELGLGHTTITLGERGSITFARGDILNVTAYPVRAVDTTGAGDVFHGGYIYGILQRWNLEETVRFASAMAALKCLKLGGRSGIPTLAEVTNFLKAHKK